MVLVNKKLSKSLYVGNMVKDIVEKIGYATMLIIQLTKITFFINVTKFFKKKKKKISRFNVFVTFAYLFQLEL